MSRLAVLLYRKGRHNIRETYVVPSFFLLLLFDKSVKHFVVWINCSRFANIKYEIKAL